MFPLVGVLLGIVFLGEQVVWQQILGGSLIISGIVIVNQMKGSFAAPFSMLHDKIMMGNRDRRG
jgi:drug/metabolite transporter (DMT)-like permease